MLGESQTTRSSNSLAPAGVGVWETNRRSASPLACSSALTGADAPFLPREKMTATALLAKSAPAAQAAVTPAPVIPVVVLQSRRSGLNFKLPTLPFQAVLTPLVVVAHEVGQS